MAEFFSSDNARWGMIVAVTLLLGLTLRLSSQRRLGQKRIENDAKEPRQRLWFSRGLIVISLIVVAITMFVVRRL